MNENIFFLRQSFSILFNLLILELTIQYHSPFEIN